MFDDLVKENPNIVQQITSSGYFISGHKIVLIVHDQPSSNATRITHQPLLSTIVLEDSFSASLFKAFNKAYNMKLLLKDTLEKIAQRDNFKNQEFKFSR